MQYIANIYPLKSNFNPKKSTGKALNLLARRDECPQARARILLGHNF